MNHETQYRRWLVVGLVAMGVGILGLLVLLLLARWLPGPRLALLCPAPGPACEWLAAWVPRCFFGGLLVLVLAGGLLLLVDASLFWLVPALGQREEAGEGRPCPNCARTVPPAANMCPYCGEGLPPHMRNATALPPSTWERPARVLPWGKLLALGLLIGLLFLLLVSCLYLLLWLVV